MVDFSLSPDAESLRDLARKFARTEMAPHAAECDRTSRFPEEIYRKAHALGLMNLNVPTEYGGSGLGLFEQCLIVEELAYGCGGMTTTVIANCLALEPILLGEPPSRSSGSSRRSAPPTSSPRSASPSRAAGATRGP